MPQSKGADAKDADAKKIKELETVVAGLRKQPGYGLISKLVRELPMEVCGEPVAFVAQEQLKAKGPGKSQALFALREQAAGQLEAIGIKHMPLGLLGKRLELDATAEARQAEAVEQYLKLFAGLESLLFTAIDRVSVL